MQIVQLYNGKYALRKWTLFGYYYADNGNLRRSSKVYWWDLDCGCFTHTIEFIEFETLEELKDVIEKYDKNVYLDRMKKDKQEAKDRKAAAKEKYKITVVSKGIKLGKKVE